MAQFKSIWLLLNGNIMFIGFVQNCVIFIANALEMPHWMCIKWGQMSVMASQITDKFNPMPDKNVSMSWRRYRYPFGAFAYCRLHSYRHIVLATAQNLISALVWNATLESHQKS